MFGWLFSFSVAEWFANARDYIIAAAMIGGGIYLSVFFDLAATNPAAWLLRPLRFVGYALVILGVAFAYGTYRESIGASKCEAAWKQKNLELKIANLQRDLDAAKIAANAKAEEAKALAAQKQDADDKLNSYASYAAGLSASIASCRRATGDDDRRMCDILGNAAPGCKPAK